MRNIIKEIEQTIIKADKVITESKRLVKTFKGMKKLITSKEQIEIDIVKERIKRMGLK